MKKVMMMALIAGMLMNGAAFAADVVEEGSSYAVSASDVAITAEDMNLTSSAPVVYSDDPMTLKKAVAYAAMPIMAAGAIVGYAVIAPFALVRWALTPEKK